MRFDITSPIRATCNKPALVPRAVLFHASVGDVGSKAIFWSDLEAFFFYYTSDGDFFQLDDRSSINVILRCIIEK